jgi:hypothetical protein
MIEVFASVNVDRVPHEVFDYLADISNNARWQTGIERCTWTSDPPLRQESTYDQEARLMGRRIVSSFDVIEFEPDYRIRVKTTGGAMPVDVIREVSRRSDGGSRVRATVRGEPEGWFLVFGFAVRWTVRAAAEADCRRLKTLLES